MTGNLLAGWMNAVDIFENSGEFRFKDRTKLALPIVPRVAKLRTLAARFPQYAVSAPRCGTAKKIKPTALSLTSFQ